MRKRNRHVSVWMNEAEYRHLKAQAEIAGLGVDPFIRMLVAGVQLRPRPPDTYAALLRELSAIGNNVNQIAHWANARKDVSKNEEKTSLSAALDYVGSEKKTGHFVAGLNCEPGRAFEEMQATKRRWDKRKGILGWHCLCV